MDDQRKICVGMIFGSHGVRGQVRLRSFTEDPEDVFVYRPLTDETGQKQFTLKRMGVMKDHFIATVGGVQDRDEADALRGVKVYVERKALPAPKAGDYYDADLIDLAVKSDEPRAVGKIVALHDYGAGSFLEIEPATGSSYMLPFTKVYVPVVDIAGGFVEVKLPEGWLDKAKEEVAP